MKAQELKRIVKFTLFGAIGFGVGGAVAGGIQQAISSQQEMFAIIVFFFTIPVWGAIAGLVLGLAFWDWRKVITLSFLGAIGLTAGGLIGTLVAMVLKPPAGVYQIVWFGVTSIVIAWVLGFGIWRDLRNWRKMLVLALAGALGFGLSAYIIQYHYNAEFMLMGWHGLSWMWVGIIGGASVGAVVGYLEKREKEPIAVALIQTLPLALELEKAEPGPPPEPPAVAAERGGFWSKYKWLITAFAVVTVVVVVLVWQVQPKSELEVGALAPDFQLLDLDGNNVSLSDLRGSPVVLNFWATWCGPCRAEMPHIQAVFEEWSDEGLVILTINLRESASTARQFMQSNNLSFPVLLDTDSTVAVSYNVMAIPTTFFIDEDGVIQERRIGSFPSKEAIENSLSKIITTTGMTSPPTTTSPPATDMTQVTFSDANLEAAIRETINKPQGPIYNSDLESLTTLGALGGGISDLTGLEYCVNLQWLDLFGNSISDISPLAGLTNLDVLLLWENNISDISLLVANSGLATGDTVDLRGNPLSTTSVNVYIPQLEARGVLVMY